MAIGAARFFGEPVDGVSAAHDFHPGFGQRLALLHGHQAGDVVGAAAQEVGGFAHDLRALEGADLAPGGEAALGGGQRRVQIDLGGVGDGADHLLIGGVEHLDAAALGAATPGAGDVEEGIGVGGHVVSPVCETRMGPAA